VGRVRGICCHYAMLTLSLDDDDDGSPGCRSRKSRSWKSRSRKSRSRKSRSLNSVRLGLYSRSPVAWKPVFHLFLFNLDFFISECTGEPAYLHVAI
jgi:hypothetical protein